MSHKKIIFMFFCILPFFIYAQDESNAESNAESNITPVKPPKLRDPLKALVEIKTDEIMELKPFKITILVNHPNPEEVIISPPNFNDEFFFERLSVSPHIMDVGRKTPRIPLPDEEEDDSHKWTSIEITLVPAKEGQFTLSSWTITSPQHTITTLPLQLVVIKGKDKEIPPSFVWAGAESIRVQESGIAFLRVTNLENDEIKYPYGIVIPVAAPRNAIVEKLPVSHGDEQRGTVLKIRINPLDGKEIHFEAHTVRYRSWYLVVPELKIAVRPGSNSAKSGGQSLNSKEIAQLERTFSQKDNSGLRGTLRSTPKNKYLDFPAPVYGGILKTLDGGAFDELIKQAGTHWNLGAYAASLALLRRGERNFIAGAAVARLRREAEARLELPLLHNEVWLPPRIFFALAAAGALIILFCAAIWIVRRIINLRLERLNQISGVQAAHLNLPVNLKEVRFSKKRFVLGAALVVIGAAGIIASKLESGNRAVLSATEIYNLPEIISASGSDGAASNDGETAAFFSDGMPVKLLATSGEWFYVEAPDGTTGWTPRSAAFVY